MTAEPAARAPRSRVVRGTWPSYLGGGRLRTEKGLAELRAARRRSGGNRRMFEASVRAVGMLSIAVDGGRRCQDEKGTVRWISLGNFRIGEL